MRLPLLSFRASALICIPLGIALGATLIRSAQAQGMPAFVNYQGRLTTPIGAPVKDGTYAVRFRLYGAATGGTALWSSEQSVNVRNGFFSVMLGAGSEPFPAGLFAKPLWLETAVAGLALGPRQPLGSVPFAMTALSVPDGRVTTVMIANLAVTTEKIADKAVTEAKLAPGLTVPVGTVVAWYGDSGSVPSNWKFCDGSAISLSGSPLNGKVAPDLRDRFIRGASGNVKETLPTGGQDEVDLTHSHTVNAHNHRIATGDKVNIQLSTSDQIFTCDIDGKARAIKTSGNDSGQAITANTADASPGTSSSLGKTSIVPRYVGLIYIMRVK